MWEAHAGDRITPRKDIRHLDLGQLIATCCSNNQVLDIRQCGF